MTDKVNQPTFLDDFSSEWMDRSEKFARQFSLDKAGILFSQGDESDGLYIIKSGRVKVFISDDSGKEMMIAVLGPGEVVGEIASLDGERRTASVAAVEPATVLHIGHDDFKNFLKENHELAFEIIQILTRRIRSYADSVSNLAFKNVYERVVVVLEQNSTERANGSRLVDGPFTHQAIADMVGSSREMVSRIMSELIKGDYISVDNRIITIHRKLPKGW
jgi:CRP/FNR family cyclic AMP-dependent transcriptional regulator